MTVTLMLTMAFGLPDTTPNQQITGTMAAPGGRATLTIATSDGT